MKSFVKQSWSQALERGDFKCPKCDGTGNSTHCNQSCIASELQCLECNDKTWREECGRCENGLYIDVSEQCMKINKALCNAWDANVEIELDNYKSSIEDGVSLIVCYRAYLKHSKEDYIANACIRIFEFWSYIQPERDWDKIWTEGISPISSNITSGLISILRLVNTDQSLEAFRTLRRLCKANGIILEEHIKARLDYEKEINK